MKKLSLFLLSLLLFVGVLVGCGSNADEEGQDQNNEQTEQQEQVEQLSFPVTITDATGEEVVIEKEPERIISLIPSNTEISFELGLGDKIVGVTENDDYPEEVLEIEKVGDYDVNVEKVISLKPDLVLAHEILGDNFANVREQLQNSGITVLVVPDAASFAETYETIEMIGKATGTLEEAEKVVAEMKETVESFKEKAANVTEKKSVLFEIDPTPFVAGSNTFLQEILDMINGENVVGDMEGWPQVDQELLIERNPDVIITTYGDYIDGAVDQVKARDGWQDVNAVKNNEVYDINSDLVTVPGPRLVEGVEEVAKAVYPEIFNE